jgi:methanogenic corrinoid protein MtbC1
VGAPRPTFDEQRAQLARAIEVDVIPRLMRAHPAPGRPTASGKRSGLAAASGAVPVGQFAWTVLTNEFSVTARHVEALRVSGVPLEAICCDLLAPAARYLGEMWEADLCDFTDVTLGLWRLQQVLRELSDAVPAERAHPVRGLRALLVPAPGEQHTFGLAMVMEFFRRAGWDVCAGPCASASELRALAKGNWFDIVGMSVAVGSRLDLVTACIRAARKTSRNRAVGIIVGGGAFAGHPELVERVGADALVVDGLHAPLQAERLLARLAQGARGA